MSSNLVRYAVIGAIIISYKIEWFSIAMTTNKDNDTSERSGCHRKRTAGEMPMNDLTNHTHGG